MRSGRILDPVSVDDKRYFSVAVLRFLGRWAPRFRFGFDGPMEPGTCPFSGKDYFCANRCPVMSLILNGELFGCGATEFEKEDLRLRKEYVTIHRALFRVLCQRQKLSVVLKGVL